MGKLKLLIALIVGLGLLAFVVFLVAKPESESVQIQTTAPAQEENIKPAEEEPVGFDKTLYSIDEPDSIWLVVNKNRPIPKDYKPELVVPNVKLRLAASAEQMHFSKAAVTALEEMFAAAKADGVALVFGSGYRSYALQKQFYDSYVARDGVEAADKYSARPGTSEHQTGLSFDATSSSLACHLEICFEDTAEGKWLAEHAHEYGFTLRYLEGKESITTYQYEPWHFRYVGKELAAELKKTGQTLEEFFGVN